MDELMAALSVDDLASPPRRSISPAVLAAELDGLIGVVERLIPHAPETLTARQLLFFLAVARKDLRHSRVTLSQIRSEFEGLGRSIEKSKDILLEPSRSYPKAVDWLTQEHDPEDRRVRYLRLTPRGLDLLAHVFGN